MLKKSCVSTLEASKKKLLHEHSMGGGGGGFSPIDMEFGTYNKLHLYFQLSGNTWCLIGFHGNNNQINGVTGDGHLGFLNFQILFKFKILYFKMTRKQ